MAIAHLHSVTQPCRVQMIKNESKKALWHVKLEALWDHGFQAFLAGKAAR